MIMPRFSGVRQWVRRWQARARPGALILLYHRVARLPFDPQWLAVTPEVFREHMRVLRANFEPQSLTEAVMQPVSASPRRRPVIVTFDDGYADNLLAAKPILEEFDISATVFVATANVDDGHEFWWDELEHLVFSPAAVPSRLELTLQSRVHTWQLETPELGVAAPTSWHVLSDELPSARHRVYKDLAALIKPLPVGERDALLAELSRWSGQTRATRSTHRPLTASEVADLERGGLISVGAHTVHHPMLSALPEAGQREEIGMSKRRLEQLVGHEIAAFSYPFGGTQDFSVATITAAQECGFRCACANVPGRVIDGTDRFQLPRFLVRDWDKAEFARQLDSFVRA